MANDGALLLLATAFFILISTGGCSHDSSPASVIQNSSNDHFWHVLNQLEAPTSVAEHHPDLDQISANGPEEPEAPGVLERVDNHSVKSHQNLHGIHVASWRWDEIGIYFTFTTFIIIAGLAKVGNVTFLTFSHSLANSTNSLIQLPLKMHPFSNQLQQHVKISELKNRNDSILASMYHSPAIDLHFNRQILTYLSNSNTKSSTSQNRNL